MNGRLGWFVKSKDPKRHVARQDCVADSAALALASKPNGVKAVLCWFWWCVKEQDRARYAPLAIPSGTTTLLGTALRHQGLNESLGLPSSARSPRWFTASLRSEAAAKTVRPMGVPERGPAMVRARPAALPRNERKWRSLVGIPRRFRGGRSHRPYRPLTKGKVERSVSYLRDSFLNGRTFDGLDDLNAQGRHWLGHVANVRVHGTT